MGEHEYEGLRIVGWGPFRLPGERRRLRKAEEYAREMMEAQQKLVESDGTSSVSSSPPPYGSK